MRIPTLEGATELKFEKLTVREVAAGVDVVLLGLPHRVSATQVPELIETGVRIVDLSGDFRLRDAATYERYYGGAHPRPRSSERFVYGLPELNRERIRKAKWVASPGCFATTIELGLLPLARAGLLDGEVETVGITGSSGSGIAPSAGTHHPVRAGNLRTYKPLEHQHVPEIEETLAAAGAPGARIRFVPVSAPLARGIFATSFVARAGIGERRQGARALRGGVRERALRARAGQATSRGRRRGRLQLRRGRRRRSGPRPAAAGS